MELSTVELYAVFFLFNSIIKKDCFLIFSVEPGEFQSLIGINLVFNGGIASAYIVRIYGDLP